MAQGSQGRPKTLPAMRPVTEKVSYQCQICLQDRIETDFFLSPGTASWNGSGKHPLICKDCADKRFRQWSESYGPRVAMIGVCALLDWPFLSDAFDKASAYRGGATPLTYEKAIVSKRAYATFVESVANGEVVQMRDGATADVDVEWTPQDIQNKRFVLSVFGYDPLLDTGLTDADRRYCFNVLSSYCDTDGIQQDGHKLQSVIELAQLQLQAHKLNELVNVAMQKFDPDTALIKSLTDTKSKILSSISTLVSDNKIASAYNKSGGKGRGCLGEKMKEMLSSGIEEAKVNMFDIKTCEAMKQIADISHRSILDQLDLDANDLTVIVKEQRDMLMHAHSERDQLAEENRKLKNELSGLTGGGGGA